MPPPAIGCKPGEEPDPEAFAADDPYGWPVTETEETWELGPGLKHVADEIFGSLLALAHGRPAPLIRGHGGRNLEGNPYWDDELASRNAALAHERFVIILPLALSRTQDDKGRVRWTLFGSSEQGPERAFWRSFWSDPEHERPAVEGIDLVARLLEKAYGIRAGDVPGLLAAGFRILPSGFHHPRPEWSEQRLPSWVLPFLVGEEGPFDGIRFLVSFRPFTRLPAQLRSRYLDGLLHLWPFPPSLVFWGTPSYGRLAEDLDRAIQIPLLRLTRRHGGPGLRIPQSGWIHEPGRRRTARNVHEGLLRESFARTHRWQRVERHHDEAVADGPEDRVVKVLFSTDLDAIGLYDKPMARNCQLWDESFRLVLDGPRAGEQDLRRACEMVHDGGLFGYRFQYPAMRVGAYEVFWQRPLIAFLSPDGGNPTVLDAPPTGFLTAYDTSSPAAEAAAELWPRLLRRPVELGAVSGFTRTHDHTPRQTAINILAIAAAWRGLAERPLERSFASALLHVPRSETLEQWLESLPSRADDPAVGRRVRDGLLAMLVPAAPGSGKPVPPDGQLTFGRTATRAYEEAYWRDIATLAHGSWLAKDNADCVSDAATRAHNPRRERDLEPLGEYLMSRHRWAIAAAGMDGRAWCGEVPFRWETDFPFPLFGGWAANRDGHAHERNLLVVIPGRQRGDAVVLADHYDTAYMEDVYDRARGGSGARLAAPGADDNASATATLLQAAPVFLSLAAAGRLERDVWLLHLTGEEFPADCLGARAFCRALRHHSLVVQTDRGPIDLSATQVAGLVVMDMIAHNRPSAPYVFQIAPGDGPAALAVALAAHHATEAWNRSVPGWNLAPERHGRGPGHRSADPNLAPPTAEHPTMFGEVRLHFTPRSSLFNTDGQVFSDLGIPAVLFMEDYDISRQGYHDLRDTVENIDLDYGAAVSAIAIETVARIAVGREEPCGAGR